MRKREISFLLCICMLCLLLAACGCTPADSAEDSPRETETPSPAASPENHTEQSDPEPPDPAADFVRNLAVQYGVVSPEAFPSCIGTETQNLSGIQGLVSVQPLSFPDGTKALAALSVSDGCAFLFRLYVLRSGTYAETASYPISIFSYASAGSIDLYYSDALQSFCLFVERSDTGTYTGADTMYAELCTVSADSVTRYRVWETFPPFVDAGEPVDFHAELTAAGVPHAKYCTEIAQQGSVSYFRPLCEIVHSATADPPPLCTHTQQIRGAAGPYGV